MAKLPRFHLHVTPTSVSWLNLVERWFAALTTKQLRRGAHRSVAALKLAIREFLDVHNEAPKPVGAAHGGDNVEEVYQRCAGGRCPVRTRCWSGDSADVASAAWGTRARSSPCRTKA